MRKKIKNFKEFHSVQEWRDYIAEHMPGASITERPGELVVQTNREWIGRFQAHGYGYIQECRSKERLAKEQEIQSKREEDDEKNDSKTE